MIFNNKFNVHGDSRLVIKLLVNFFSNNDHDLYWVWVVASVSEI